MLRRLGILLLTTLLLGEVIPARAQSAERCFPETGQCISGRIREFWEQNGGLPVFGFPIGPQQEMTIEGMPLQAQWFERNRLELHPENSRPYDVLLGRLSVDRLTQQGRDWFAFRKVGRPIAGCRYFPETGHNICGSFLRAWSAAGIELDGQAGLSEVENLAFLGLPLSWEVPEVFPNGAIYVVQWFERGRLESHPENPPPYNMQLGLLGREVIEGGSTPPPPAPPAQPIVQPATPIPQPTAQPAASGNCHPSYPTVCIPPPPPDLDCGDIPYRRFRVVGSDPHRFDRDRDGIGCES